MTNGRRRRRRFDFSGAREKTNTELADELATLTTMSADQIESLLPNRVDKERLAQLVSIVSSATSQNSKIAALGDNLSELGGVTLRLLKKILV